MPLLDHFHPPLTPGRHWESFHATWCVTLMEQLNEKTLPPGYFAEAQVHVGSRIETDVATLESEGGVTVSGNGEGGVATQTYAPPATATVMTVLFPDEVEVQVLGSSAGLNLVAAIELISPGNKDRPEARRLFVSKCAAYLQTGVGLLIVDVVTERLANLHNELIDFLQQGPEFVLSAESGLYAVAYRPRRRDPGGDQIDVWTAPLALSQTLPVMPLALRGSATVPVDLEAAYSAARRRSRL
jgi:hypothetical protein